MLSGVVGVVMVDGCVDSGQLMFVVVILGVVVVMIVVVWWW